jgi:hypothetical protein
MGETSLRTQFTSNSKIMSTKKKSPSQAIQRASDMIVKAEKRRRNKFNLFIVKGKLQRAPTVNWATR